MITGQTRVFGLIGHPVRHSLSPAMHNELFRRRKIDGVYAAFDVAPGRAGGVASAIRTLGLSGVNLTVPFKEAVMADLDGYSSSAGVAGAVNVVVVQNGELIGYNTDGVGYLRALKEELGADVSGRAIAILGAGGTARAIAAALAADGAVSVTFFNRTMARAEAACAALGGAFSGVRFQAAPLAAGAFRLYSPSFDIVVNCTGGGAVETVAGFDVRGLRAGAIWSDVNYWMPDPPQLVACAGRGVRIQRGIGMLVHQGAESFRLFTGVAVDGDTVRGVLDLGGW